MLSETRQNFLPFGLHQVAMQSATGKTLLQNDKAVKGGVALLTVGILANTSVKKTEKSYQLYKYNINSDSPIYYETLIQIS